MTPITITENTGVSARYLPFHAQCQMPPCKWGANFSDELDAQRTGLRHHCKGDHMKGRSITQIITEGAEASYRAWDVEVAKSGMSSVESKFLQGRLQGACEALAVIRNPYNPDPADVAKGIQERCDKVAEDALKATSGG